ncbi:hypothetical protein SAMN05421739_103191 [Pontibacter chinhatensis]|uniref:Uncharacterized protein n=1 Tax=Pontibacter chinhatensis TaxID=1436961 RepID=A0A1I2TLL7_9BACT|nr:hypothetical protein SAMN05421739_103191 [Pontibacter chinhatensis]
MPLQPRQVYTCRGCYFILLYYVVPGPTTPYPSLVKEGSLCYQYSSLFAL